MQAAFVIVRQISCAQTALGLTWWYHGLVVMVSACVRGGWQGRWGAGKWPAWRRRQTATLSQWAASRNRQGSCPALPSFPTR